LHTKKFALAAVLTAGALSMTACGSSDNNSSNSPSTPPPSSPSSSDTSSGGAGSPQISVSDFTKDFSAMAQLKDVASKGQGKIAVILPDTTTSARYTQFDAPYLQKAFEMAGLSSSDFSIQNAQGSTATQLTDAQSAITNGARVLVVDPLDKGVGASIENYAKAHGVDVIDYDRLTLGGTRSYYVSFDNVKVGKLIGTGLTQCVTDWHVKSPKVIEMAGDPTDNNATLFQQGYDSVLKPLVSSGKYTITAKPAGTWDPPTALTEFQQAFTAHSDSNAVLVPNDANAAPIITYLKSKQVPAKTFPVTGQDASVPGLQNILTGYQCGTAYKPIYLEAQGAAALAIYLNAGLQPPSGLVNGTTEDTDTNTQVPSALLIPEWVTIANMKDTVVADGAVTVKELCGGAIASACTAAGIK
jgi:D-xylose transport system substrate-binding protein